MKIMKVNGMVRDSIPEPHETIEDDFYLDRIIPVLRDYSVYRRSPEECPFGRGNLVLDMHLKNGEIYAIKFPLSMTRKQLTIYLKPLRKRIEN